VPITKQWVSSKILSEATTDVMQGIGKCQALPKITGEKQDHRFQL
jgi:hypothetical protein